MFHNFRHRLIGQTNLQISICGCDFVSHNHETRHIFAARCSDDAFESIFNQIVQDDWVKGEWNQKFGSNGIEFIRAYRIGRCEEDVLFAVITEPTYEFHGELIKSSIFFPLTAGLRKLRD